MITSTFPALDASGVPARESLAARFRILMRAPGRTMTVIDAATVATTFEDGERDDAFFGNAGAACGILGIDYTWSAGTVLLHPVVIFRAECAWCSAVEREGTPGAPLSHTICDACVRTLYRNSESNS
jgi:hypothetical protein